MFYELHYNVWLSLEHNTTLPENIPCIHRTPMATSSKLKYVQSQHTGKASACQWHLRILSIHLCLDIFQSAALREQNCVCRNIYSERTGEIHLGNIKPNSGYKKNLLQWRSPHCTGKCLWGLKGRIRGCIYLPGSLTPVQLYSSQSFTHNTRGSEESSM